jgi:DNA ligase-1
LNVLESVIRKYVQPLFPNGVVLDGEVCVIDSNGAENFKGVMTEIKKKDHTMKNPRYLLFDCLSLSEFSSGTSERIFSERLKDLGQIKAATNVPGTYVPELLVIDQVNYTPEKLADMSELVEKHGWEGLMVRKDAKYEGKRTSSVLKVKKFQREEYKVVDTQVGPYQALNKDTGLTETIETMVSVTILHKNFPVSVGSGFSLEERKQYYNNPEKIKGKIISVQFFEETEGSDGNLSLRFPTFKGLYGNTRTI